MIQRVQTIWLLLASLTLMMLLLVPIVTKINDNTEFWILVSGLYQKAASGTAKIEAFTALMVSTLVVSVITFANIFAFSNRTLQKRICNVVIILIISLSFWISQAAQKIPGGLENVNYNVGAFMPVLAILFVFMAMRGIRKDEQLIKSADRLR